MANTNYNKIGMSIWESKFKHDPAKMLSKSMEGKVHHMQTKSVSAINVPTTASFDEFDNYQSSNVDMAKKKTAELSLLID